MKRILPLFFCLFLLTGCFLDIPFATRIVNDLSDLVEEYNAIANVEQSNNPYSKEIYRQVDAELQKMEETKYNSKPYKPQPDILKKAIFDSKKIQQLYNQKKKRFQKLNNQVKQMKGELDTLSEEREKKATEAINDLNDLIDQELKILSLEMKEAQEYIDYLQPMTEGKEPPRKRHDPTEEPLANAIQRQHIIANAKLGKFNDSWDNFHKDVTGKGIKKTFKNLEQFK